VQRKNSRSADQVNALDAASKAAFETLNRRIDRMDDRLERVENGINSILVLLQEQAAASSAKNDPPTAAAAAAVGGQQEQGKCFF
jgi:hypothetical protein